MSNPGVHVWYGSMCCSSSMQKLTVKFVTGNYNYETGNMTGILGRLIVNTSKKGGKAILYKGLKVKVILPIVDLIPLTQSGRKHHSMRVWMGHND